MSTFVACIDESLNHEDENNKRVDGINTTVSKPASSTDSSPLKEGAYPRAIVPGSVTKISSSHNSNGNYFTNGTVFNYISNQCPPSTSGLSTCSLLTVELTPDPSTSTPIPNGDSSDAINRLNNNTPTTDTFLRDVVDSGRVSDSSFDNIDENNNVEDCANEDSFINSHSIHISKVLDNDDVVLKSNDSDYSKDDSATNVDNAAAKDDEEEEEVSDEERVRRDIEASERLAWEMMRQESLETYRLQMEYMQENSAHLSQEDLAMIQQVVNESAQALNTISSTRDGDEEGDNEEDDENSPDGSDPDDWDYDRLLALGEQIGDVKTELWKAKAPKVIEKLHQMTYEHVLQEMNLKQNSSSIDSGNNDGNNKKMRFNLEEKCAVCMEIYQESESLIILNCSHYFHAQCAAGWISGRNSCPLCKRKVVPTP